MDTPDNTPEPRVPPVRPWIHLKTTYDVEAWIDGFNRNLRRVLEDAKIRNPVGPGIRFELEHGGELFLHTTADGDILLDVTPEAEWVVPLIAAATRGEPPRGRIWPLPGHVLTQLIMGLSSLIATSQLVTTHDFRMKKY